MKAAKARTHTPAWVPILPTRASDRDRAYRARRLFSKLTFVTATSCGGRQRTSACCRAAGCLYGAAAAQSGRFQSSHPLECPHFPSASLYGDDRGTSPELFAARKTVQHGLSYQRCGEADEKFQKLKPRPRVTPGSSCFRAASHASGPHRASLMQLFLERGRQGCVPSRHY